MYNKFETCGKKYPGEIPYFNNDMIYYQNIINII